MMTDERLLRCSACKESLPARRFHLERRNKRGRQYKCIDCRGRNITPLRYLRDVTYKNMLGRVRGQINADRKDNTWIGKPIVPRDEFVQWALQRPEFQIIWDAWVEAGRPRRLAPSIDRLDTTGGYTIDNMRWVSQGSNSRKGS